MGKIITGKYGLKLIDHTKQSAIDVVKTALNRGIQKIVKATCNLTGSKIANKIKKVAKTSQNTLATVPDEVENIGFDAKIPKETHISQ